MKGLAIYRLFLTTRVVLVYTLIWTVLASCSQVPFQTTYEGRGEADTRSVTYVKGGGYIMVGRTRFQTGEGTDVFVIRTDQFGDSLWTRTYGGSQKDIGYEILQCSDGGFIILGRTRSFGAKNGDVYLIKIDSEGTMIWDEKYGGTGKDFGFAIEETADLGYIIAGKSNSDSHGKYDVILIKTDKNGELIWQKTYGGKQNDYGYDVKQTEDGGYIIAGRSRSLYEELKVDSGAMKPDVYVIKTDSIGGVIWERTFGGIQAESAYAVGLKDGNYLIAGRVNLSSNNQDVLLLNIDPEGKILWTKNFGGSKNEYVTDMLITDDGSIILAGLTNSSGAGGYDAYLLKLNDDYSKKWSRTYGGKRKDIATSVTISPDGGFAIGGKTRSYSKEFDRAYLVITNNKGKTVNRPTSRPSF